MPCSDPRCLPLFWPSTAPLRLGPGGARTLKRPAVAAADQNWRGSEPRPRDGLWAVEPQRAEHLRPDWGGGPCVAVDSGVCQAAGHHPRCGGPGLGPEPGSSRVNGSTGSHVVGPRPHQRGASFPLARRPSCLQGGGAGARGGRWRRVADGAAGHGWACASSPGRELDPPCAAWAGGPADFEGLLVPRPPQTGGL